MEMWSPPVKLDLHFHDASNRTVNLRRIPSETRERLHKSPAFEMFTGFVKLLIQHLGWNSEAAEDFDSEVTKVEVPTKKCSNAN